jgi:uncharacterized membrane protein YcaP (DUF421 family)
MLLADTASVTMVQSVGQFLQQIFGSDTPDDSLALYQIAARAIVVYVVGLVIVRVGKSRIISRTTALDVIVGFILGSLLSRGITGHASISGTTVAAAAIVAAHWLFTLLACQSHRFGTLIKGNSELVVKDGQPIPNTMRHSHISMHDLIEQLRLSGVAELQEVREAYKERNGEISVIKRREPPHVIEVAVQDGVQTVRIALG